MVQFKVPRHSDLTLEITISRGDRPEDGGLAELRYRGRVAKVALDPRHVRIIRAVVKADVEDEVNGVAEIHRGFRSTAALGQEYADQIGDVVPLPRSTVARYFSQIRDLFKCALRDLNIEPDRFDLFERMDSIRFRFGNVTVHLKDYNLCER